MRIAKVVTFQLFASLSFAIAVIEERAAFANTFPIIIIISFTQSNDLYLMLFCISRCMFSLTLLLNLAILLYVQ